MKNTILVVDDSPVDRRLVGGLLEKESDWSIEYAEDGQDALEKMLAGAPDLVVTDLFMPQMDGLDLVAEIRSKFRTVPVVLITSKGNEEIAAQALQRGAASYVPKRLLSRYLTPTVHSLLAVSRDLRSRAKLLGSMTASECSFALENDIDMIPSLVGYLQESVSHLGLGDEAERFQVAVALEEALVNAVHHGNLEVDSSLREGDGKAYFETIRQRRATAPYKDRRVFVQARLSDDEAVFVIRDEGPGFDPGKLPDPTDPENIERASGRGVLLMKTFMDDVIYNDVGNQVTLIKRAGQGGNGDAGE